VLVQALRTAGETGTDFSPWRIGESRSLLNIDSDLS
jgi:hypothetical protein